MIFWEPFASACEKSGDECVLATGDRDSLQLVSRENKCASLHK